MIAGREVYASDILSELKNSQLLVVEGTLYPILTRLKNDGSLNYRWEESSSGPPRKYYSITPLGVEMLQELREGWQGLIESVNQLLVQSDSTLSSTEKIN
ncbi:MAG: PadR family transcriptional regulator [Bacteroidales bacterium]|nr:PadR family transcriptional regulator [Bacteroidales bacterium]